MEMTCVLASFGEPIKDGLSSHRRTEGERKPAGVERASGAGREQGIEIPVSDLGRKEKLSSGNAFSYRGHKVEDKRAEHSPLSVCGDGAAPGDTQM